jgi:hypothetical protein
MALGFARRPLVFDPGDNIFETIAIDPVWWCE